MSDSLLALCCCAFWLLAMAVLAQALANICKLVQPVLLQSAGSSRGTRMVLLCTLACANTPAPNSITSALNIK